MKKLGHNKLGLLFLAPDTGGSGGGTMAPEAFQAKVLGGVEELQKKSTELEGKIAKAATAEEFTKLRGEFDTLLEQTRALQKASLSASSRRALRAGHVSDETARHLGALAIVSGIRGGQLGGDRWNGIAKDVLGAEVIKAALTSSDIPLPVQYSGEVVELVSAYGAARRFGTVFPLGAGSVKLPQLTTDTTFGLIAGSGTVTEKSPQVGWVTFTPEKFGGLVRLPTEMDEDSVVAIGQFVARYSARQIARAEDSNFFVGTGAGSGVNGSVKGLAVSTIDNSKVVQQGSGKTKTSDLTLANMRAIRAVVDAPAIALGAYYAHPSMEQAFSGLNTAGDKPYVANGANGATLDGFPIRWVDVMPVYSTSAQVSKVYLLFGDVSFQYLGVRGGVRFDTSKEAGFTTDEILIRALERFTIGLMATGAVAGLETAAS
ncbi:MAG: phage major capsid protein [Verrucomicrobiota bacterium]